MNELKTILMDISGFGLIFYSPFAVHQIKEGQDYFDLKFQDPVEVEKQAREGRLVGLNLGSPGHFIINIFAGYPSSHQLANFSLKMRLGIEIRDDVLCIRDLFDLIDWTAEVPDEQVLTLPSGFYHMTFLSDLPASGVRGDGQEICLYLQRLDAMPILRFDGVPMLV